MRSLLSLLSGTIFLFGLAQAQHYDYGVDVGHIIKRQDPSSKIVIGKLPLALDGSIPARVEIRDFKNDKYSWDLYILALSMLQYVNQNNPLSWYQIAGIHGVPFAPWNGVQAVPGGAQSGYCTHASILFPMWHRPYVALYEQQLYKLVNGIATLFTDPKERELYTQAASTFRTPYWDWSIMAPEGQTHFPEPFWSPFIAQYGPNGVQNIRNPLYSYVFHPLDEPAIIWMPVRRQDDGAPIPVLANPPKLKQWNETKRYPNTSISSVAPPSRNDEVSSNMLRKLPSIQQRLYILFSNYHDYNSFSNKAWGPLRNLTTLESIESIHDSIHGVSGGSGHMTYVPLSSFDPIFFLHHAMTDRLIAMWQALNPTSWVQPMVSGETTFTALKGTVQTSASPLAPFLASADGTFWTSDSARTTDAFGYIYKDVGSFTQFNDSLRQALTQKINTLYAPSSANGLRARHVGRSNSRKSAIVPLLPGFQLSSLTPAADQAIHHGHYTEWVANVQVKSGALTATFFLHFFLGEPSDNVHEWELTDNHVGSVPIFTMRHGSAPSESSISGSLPLTTTLMKMLGNGNIQDLSPSSVVPFLNQHLTMRISSINEDIVEPESVAGLQVDISSSLVQLPLNDTEFPDWGATIPRLHYWR